MDGGDTGRREGWEHAVRCVHPIKSACTLEDECGTVARICVCGSVRFWLEQICAVTYSNFGFGTAAVGSFDL